MRIAIPFIKGRLAASFKDCEQFYIIETVNHEIKEQRLLTPPLMELWLLPHWLQEHNVDIIIVGNANERSIGVIQKAGIKVISGAPDLTPEELIHKFITDT